MRKTIASALLLASLAIATPSFGAETRDRDSRHDPSLVRRAVLYIQRLVGITPKEEIIMPRPH